MLMDNIMRYCIHLHGPPPCTYALVGMGLLARKEITPFSDFEHIILLQDGVQGKPNYERILEYFRWVSVIFQFILINLGETIIPHANLPHINDLETEEGNWFFDAHAPRGICFDRMVPFACKFPLGRQATREKSWNTELIKPVQQMLNYLREAEDLKNGYHLADILMNTCFVSGDKNLHETFKQGVEKEQMSMSLTQLQNQVKEDLRQFEPIGSLDKVRREQQLNLKKVIYRSISLFLCALKRRFCLKSTSNFEVVRDLLAGRKVNNDFVHDILHTLAIACKLRLELYTEKGRQDDYVHVADRVDDARLQVVQLIGECAAVKFFGTVLRLQREVCLFLDIHDKAFVQTAVHLDKLLALFWLGFHDETIEEARKLCALP